MTRLLAGCLWAAALIALLAMVPSLSRINDFETGYYPAGRAVLSGASPYAGSLPGLRAAVTPDAATAGRRERATSSYVYAPPFALMVAPLALLPYPMAAAAWFWMSVLALALAAAIVGHAAAPARRWLVGGSTMLAVVSFAPVRDALRFGQADVLILPTMAAALTLLYRSDGRRESNAAAEIVGGVLLGLAAVIKLYPAGFLLYALLRRQYRAVAAAAGAATIVVTVSVLVVGVAGYRDFLAVLQLGSQPGFIASPLGFGLLSFADRAFLHTPYAMPLFTLPSLLVRALVGLLSAGLIGGVLAIVRRNRPTVHSIDVALVGVASLLAFPFLELQHLALLMAVFPAAAVAIAGRLTAAGLAAGRAGGILVVLLGPALALGLLAPLVPAGAMVRVTLVLLPVSALVIAYLLQPSALSAGARTGLIMSGAAWLGLASPAFANMAAWWPVPMSSLHVVLGEGQLAFLLVLAVSLTMMAGARRWAVETDPHRSAPTRRIPQRSPVRVAS